MDSEVPTSAQKAFPEKCPFNKQHIMGCKVSKKEAHLEKCRQIYAATVIQTGRVPLKLACKYNCGKSFYGPELAYHEKHCSSMNYNDYERRYKYVDNYVGSYDRWSPTNQSRLLSLHRPSSGDDVVYADQESDLFDESVWDSLMTFHYGEIGHIAPQNTKDGQYTDQGNTAQVKPHYIQTLNNNPKRQRFGYPLHLSPAEKHKFELFTKAWKQTVEHSIGDNKSDIAGAHSEDNVEGLGFVPVSKRVPASVLDW